MAQQAGVSPGRVRQVLRLARLHSDIHKVILGLPPKDAKREFPERILRGLIPLSPEEQLNQFSANLTKLQSQSANSDAV